MTERAKNIIDVCEIGKFLIKKHHIYFMVNNDYWVVRKKDEARTGKITDTKEEIIRKVYDFIGIKNDIIFIQS